MVLSTGVAALGGLLLGFDTAVIAGTTTALSRYFALTPSQLGFTVSSAIWGTVLGGLLSGRLIRRLGTRDSLRAIALVYAISGFGCAVSSSWLTFLVFRVLTGLAIGACSVASPMHIAETAVPSLRGRLVACFQLSIVCGISLAYASNAVIAALGNSAELWRWDLGMAVLPALIFFLAVGKIPRDRQSSATGNLHRQIAPAEWPDGPSNLLPDAERRPASSNPANVFAKQYRKPLMVAFAVGLFNQFSGVNAILYYANDIFAAGGFGSLSSDWKAIAIGATNLVFTGVGMFFIDRLGRKPLLLWGSAGMTASLAGVTAVFWLNAHTGLLLPLLIAFIAVFASSQGAVVWVYLSEIFPVEVHEAGQSLASSWLWLLTAIVSGLFPVIAEHSRATPFLVFAIATAIQFFVVLKYFPETRGVQVY